MPLIELCAFMLGACVAAAPAPEPKTPATDLAIPGTSWSAFVGNPNGTTIELIPASVGVAAQIHSDGGSDDHPILCRTFDAPQNWSRYCRLRARVRVTSPDPAMATKHMAFVFYDEKARVAGPESPMRQQVISHGAVPVGRWVELDDFLSGIERSAIWRFEIYLYEFVATQAPPWSAHDYRWEFSSLRLEGVPDGSVLFDGLPFPRERLAPRPGSTAHRLETDDGLSLVLDSHGAVAAVQLDGQALGEPKAPTGLLVRDVTRPDPPQLVVAEPSPEADGLRQVARLDDLGLLMDATWISRGPYLEVAGSIADLTGDERAVTVYLTLPVGDGWRWWDSISRQRSEPDERQELACLEEQLDYGLRGAHSRYPLAAISRPGVGGLTVAVRMDEPVVHRLFYHPGLGLLTVALDFGLMPGVNVRGRLLSEAPFRILVYRHDPRWGLRSALQRYYGFFPQWFQRRVQREGTWWCWGESKDKPEAIESGAGISWGPYWLDQGQWDNAHGLLVLNYLDAEHYEQSMGDFQSAPTPAQIWERVQALAAGDPEVTAIAEKLYHARIGGGHLLMVGMDWWKRTRTVADYLRMITEATVRSVAHQADGSPMLMVEKQPWIGDSWWAGVAICNLDPDIPGGKGLFNSQVVLPTALEAWEQQGVKVDGIALDIFGAPGVNYRREHFPFADVPLTFSTQDLRPVQVVVFGSVEWLRSLADQMRPAGRVIMANSGSAGFLAFAAPYLDILGSETPTFADPDYVRALFHHKTLACLPYGPRPEAETASQLLHAVFPGQGIELPVMRRYIKALRELSAAGWEPVTGARVTPDTVRLERFGGGHRPDETGPVYLVAYNPGADAVEARIQLEPQVFGPNRWEVYSVALPPGAQPATELASREGAWSLSLQAGETRLLQVRP